MFDYSPDMDMYDVTQGIQPSPTVPEPQSHFAERSIRFNSRDPSLCPSPVQAPFEIEDGSFLALELPISRFDDNTVHGSTWEDFDLYPYTEELVTLNEEWELFQPLGTYVDYSLGIGSIQNSVRPETAIEFDSNCESCSTSSEASQSQSLSTPADSPVSSTRSDLAVSPAHSVLSSDRESLGPAYAEPNHRVTEAARSPQPVASVNTRTSQRRRSTPHPCSLCSRVFRTSVEARHVAILSSTHPYHTNIRVTRRRHHARHTKPFPCPSTACEKAFPNKNELERHRKSVHYAVPEVGSKEWFKCPVRGCKVAERPWPRRDNLRVHIKQSHPGLEGVEPV